MNSLANHATRSATTIGLVLFAAMCGCTDRSPVSIGFSIDDLRIERLRRERDGFVTAAKAQGASVKVRSADGDQLQQLQQIEGLIEQKPQVLVILPLTPDVMKESVARAQSAGIKVIAYDRLITGADIDAYISFDNECVGARLAEGSAVPVAKPGSDPGLLERIKGWFAGDLDETTMNQQMSQDPNLDACKRVIEGDSVVTAYKPLNLIASEAAKMAIKLARGEKIAYTHRVNNGLKNIDALLLSSTVVSREAGSTGTKIESLPHPNAESHPE